MTDGLDRRIALLGSDRESGASEILEEAIAILRDAIRAETPLLPVARALCRAQPSMAPVWNAALEVLSSGPPAVRLERFAARVARAPQAIARFAADLLVVDAAGPLRLVTLSFSRSVVGMLEALAPRRQIRLACSEGRPALEGRRLASRLAAVGAEVTFFSDAGLGHALGAADAVVVGADAVAPEGFLNKSGTRMLAAAAAQQGVPLYVVASRDKFVGQAVARRLVLREGAAAEIWAAPPSGVTVRNPYFETTPLDLVAGLITDAGVLDASMVADVCAAAARNLAPELIDQL